MNINLKVRKIENPLLKMPKDKALEIMFKELEEIDRYLEKVEKEKENKNK